MSNFFDDYLKLNPVETKPDKVTENAKDDDPNDNGGDEDDE